MAGSCAPAVIGNSGFAVGSFTCGSAATLAAAPAWSLTVSGPSLSVTESVAVAGSGALGSLVTYQAVVTNTGGGLITGVTLVDTLSPILTAVTTGQPSAFGSPSVSPAGASGTLYVWSAAGISLAPGQSFTLTISGTVGWVNAAVRLSNTITGAALTPCGMAIAQTGPATITVIPAGAPVYRVIAPATVVAGQPFWVTVVVAYATGTTKTDYCGITVFTSTDPTALVNGGPLGAASLAWSSGSAGCGSAPFNNGIGHFQAVLNSPCQQSVVLQDGTALVPAGSFSVTVRNLSLAASLAALPPVQIAGATLTLALTVTNTGASAAAVTPTASPRVGAPLIAYANGPFPATAMLAPGGVQTFVWNYNTVASGVVAFSATALGYQSCSGTLFAVRGTSGVSATLTPSSGPSVAFTKFVSTPAAVAGDVVTYQLVVENTGTSTLTSIRVVDTIPGVLTNIAEGQPPIFGPPTVTFVPPNTSCGTWFKNGLAIGPGVSLTFTITGTVTSICASTVEDNVALLAVSDKTGTAWLSSNDAPFVVTVPTPSIAVSLTHTPASPAWGQTVQYQMVITNTGSATITDLMAVDTFPVAVMNGVVQVPPGFPAYPFIGNQQVSSTILEAWGITNHIWPPSWTAYLVASANLQFLPGQSLTYTITGTVSQVPVLTMASAQADVKAWAGCAQAFVRTAPDSFTVLPPPGPGHLTATLTYSNALPYMGTLVEIVETIQNTGGAPVSGIQPNLMSFGSTVFGFTAGPTPTGPVTLVPGGSATFTWTYSVSGVTAQQVAIGQQLTGVYGNNMIVLTGTITGIDTWTGTSTTVRTVGLLFYQDRAVLQVRGSLSPDPLGEDQTATATITVTNVGIGRADNVLPQTSTWADLRPPSALDAGPVSLDPGQSFTWHCTVRTGPVPALGEMQINVNGTDVASGDHIVAATTLTVHIQGSMPGWVTIVGGTRGGFNFDTDELAAIMTVEDHRAAGRMCRVIIWEMCMCRQVASFNVRVTPGSPSVIHWRGLNANGNRVPPGGYVLTAQSPTGQTFVGKVLVRR